MARFPKALAGRNQIEESKGNPMSLMSEPFYDMPAQMNERSFLNKNEQTKEGVNKEAQNEEEKMLVQL